MFKEYSEKKNKVEGSKCIQTYSFQNFGFNQTRILGLESLPFSALEFCLNEREINVVLITALLN